MFLKQCSIPTRIVIIAFLVTGALCRRSRAAVTAASVEAGWDVIWMDEFDGPEGFLNDTWWDYEIGTGCQYLSGPERYPMCGWGNLEQEYYSAQNGKVQGGQLIIEAREEVDGTLTSARVHTRGKVDIAPGRQWRVVKVEARMLLPQGDGLWPAFWMLPTLNSSCLGCGKYGMWASSGEIDIMESKNGMSELWATIHFGAQWPNNTFLNVSRAQDPANPYAGVWHTFGLEWERTQMRWYFDNQLYATQVSGNGNPASGGWYSEGVGAGPNSPFGGDQEFHIIINLALGGRFTNSVPREALVQTLATPKRMQVEWVRVLGQPMA